jgi:class 3 adenylate cyclase
MAGTAASAQTGGVGYDCAALTQVMSQVPRAGLLGVAQFPGIKGDRSEQTRNYMVIGNTVNLASRI